MGVTGMGVTVWMWMFQGVRDGLSKWQSLMSPSLAQHSTCLQFLRKYKLWRQGTGYNQTEAKL